MGYVYGDYMVDVNEIDATDRRILRTIQKDGRISIVRLAAEVNLSKTPCLKRLRRLEKLGYIKGYRAELDSRKLAQGYLVYVQVSLNNTSLDSLEKFNHEVRKVEQVLSCHMMSGGYDYLLKIRTSDMDEFRTLLGDVISSLPGIDKTSSYPVMEDVKDTMTIRIKL
ncbi:Lrp/AsnC ligand binding domain-containing protein [Sphingorhabdus arenilitoris]|uniref:Lrp/AsnC ligand binding domain-containing protein n=1 Tax=Sphingorhabdus arenilitoris TaxID=1490041 RepID=A0ABV8RDK6_9SPHN